MTKGEVSPGSEGGSREWSFLLWRRRGRVYTEIKTEMNVIKTVEVIREVAIKGRKKVRRLKTG